MVGINLRSSVDEAATLRFGANPTDSAGNGAGNLLQKLSNNSWWTEAAGRNKQPPLATKNLLEVTDGR